MKDLKVRSSAIGNITHLDAATKLTDKQSIRLKELLSKIELTTPQAKERDKLTAKRDAPPALSKGAKTYIKDVFFGHKFDYQKRFTNKYTQKGNIKEASALHEVVKYLGLPMAVKNEKHFENDYTHGTPDSIFKPLDFQLDIKNAYYPNGLDSFDEKVDHIYKEQAHDYNWLTGVNHGFVCKVLMNLPEHLLEKEAYILLKEAGLNKMTDSFYEEVRDLYNFEAKPIQDRIKLFKVSTSKEDIDRLKTSVKLAREYYEELNELWKIKNIKEIEFINELKSK